MKVCGRHTVLLIIACSTFLLSGLPKQAHGYVIAAIAVDLLDGVVVSNPSIQQENGVTAAQADTGGVLFAGQPGGFASSDLSTGQLRAIARSFGVGPQTSEGIAISFMEDTLHFQVAGSLPTTIAFDLIVDGTISAPPGTQVIVSGADLIFGSFVFATQLTSCCALGTDFPFPLDIHGSLDVINGQDVLVHSEIIAVMDSFLPVTGAVDLGNTATLRLTLPPGTTFTSDSGVFLTRATAVPAPATLTIFGWGLVGLTLWAWRRPARRQLHSSIAQSHKRSEALELVVSSLDVLPRR
jgi:hypothetical protein